LRSFQPLQRTLAWPKESPSEIKPAGSLPIFITPQIGARIKKECKTMSNPNKFQGSHGLLDLSCRPFDEDAWQKWQAKNRVHDERIGARLTRGVKWACIATLLVAAALPLYIAPYQNALRFIVVGGAAMITLQALHAHRYVVAALFAVTVLLYNPVIPTFSLAGNWQVLIIYVTVALFAVSLTWLNLTSPGFAGFPNRSAR
jgi:hypothetical protein